MSLGGGFFLKCSNFLLLTANHIIQKGHMQASTKIHQPTNIESCMQQLTLHTRGYNSSGLKPTNTCSKCQENSYHYTLTCNVLFVRSRESFGGHNHRWPKTSCFQVQPVCSIHVAMMLWVYSYQVEEYYIDSF